MKDLYICPLCNTEHPKPINSNVEILTPEECGILYYHLKDHWLDRSHHFLESKNLVDRLYRRSVGLPNE